MLPQETMSPRRRRRRPNDAFNSSQATILWGPERRVDEGLMNLRVVRQHNNNKIPACNTGLCIAQHHRALSCCFGVRNTRVDRMMDYAFIRPVSLPTPPAIANVCFTCSVFVYLKSVQALSDRIYTLCGGASALNRGDGVAGSHYFWMCSAMVDCVYGHLVPVRAPETKAGAQMAI